MTEEKAKHPYSSTMVERIKYFKEEEAKLKKRRAPLDLVILTSGTAYIGLAITVLGFIADELHMLNENIEKNNSTIKRNEKRWFCWDCKSTFYTNKNLKECLDCGGSLWSENV